MPVPGVLLSYLVFDKWSQWHLGASGIKESMLTGFNHNISHAGQVYHIQTEDSGIKAPHIITHLFVGGNIIATKKTTYADVVGTAEIENVVRKMMEEQHKDMLRKLIHGDFDGAIKTRTATPPAQAAAAVTTPTAPAMPALASSAQIQIHKQAAATPQVVAGPVALNLAASAPKVPSSESTRLPPQGPQTLIMTPVPPPPAREPAPQSTPTADRAKGLAPAPVEIPDPPSIWNLPATQSSGDQRESSITQPDIPLAPNYATQPEMAPVPPPRDTFPPEVLAAQELEQPPEERPAGDTIFGEDLMSEKSLDEVILSYLADDPDGM